MYCGVSSKLPPVLLSTNSADIFLNFFRTSSPFFNLDIHLEVSQWLFFLRAKRVCTLKGFFSHSPWHTSRNCLRDNYRNCFKILCPGIPPSLFFAPGVFHRFLAIILLRFLRNCFRDSLKNVSVVFGNFWKNYVPWRNIRTNSAGISKEILGDGGYKSLKQFLKFFFWETLDSIFEWTSRIRKNPRKLFEGIPGE